jgi:hypothetical protein
MPAFRGALAVRLIIVGTIVIIVPIITLFLLKAVIPGFYAKIKYSSYA